MSPIEKPFRIRVRVTDGVPKQDRKLKGQLAPHVDFVDVANGMEFVIRATHEEHIEALLPKLASAHLEVVDGPVDDACLAAALPSPTPRGKRGRSRCTAGPNARKPYAFVPLPSRFGAEPPVWHDGTSTPGRLSGEVRFEFVTLTPMLVGWERQTVAGDESSLWRMEYERVDDEEARKFVSEAAHQRWPGAEHSNKECKKPKAREDFEEEQRSNVVCLTRPDAGLTTVHKSVLCPLRAPWGARPVVVPGDSLKGLLRHELGALLGAPMERVAERSYSYRPNLAYVRPSKKPFLVPLLARVPNDDAVITATIPGQDAGSTARVPRTLELFPAGLAYGRGNAGENGYYDFSTRDASTAPARGSEGSAEQWGRYLGGLGAGQSLHGAGSDGRAGRGRRPYQSMCVRTHASPVPVEVPEEVRTGYLRTLAHLLDTNGGHYSERHPGVSTPEERRRITDRIRQAAAQDVFQPGDFVWVEWDTQKGRIVSIGWHYYYRWAYVDTVRRRNCEAEREGLFPLPEERRTDTDGAPEQLSLVRRLFGYTGDNDGSKGIGRGHYTQLMGRIAINAALEVADEREPEDARFLRPTFLKELGMPRPSAVEFYLQQDPRTVHKRRPDAAKLLTYGDARGYDEPGELAGRKFYLDRADAYTEASPPWEDSSPLNRLNERSTLAVEASRPGRRFRFTLRFRDLEPRELAWILLALCPDQFAEFVGGRWSNGYCSKLGYARPLGWGSVRMEVKSLLFLRDTGKDWELTPVPDVSKWFREHFDTPPCLKSWLDVHRRAHPRAGDYPKGRNGQIYEYHTALRQEHAKRRRLKTAEAKSGRMQ